MTKELQLKKIGLKIDLYGEMQLLLEMPKLCTQPNGKLSRKLLKIQNLKDFESKKTQK